MDFAKKNPSATITFLLYLGMVLIASAIWESLGDFNTFACLILTVVMFICMLLGGLDRDPVAWELYGNFFLGAVKFFIAAAFLSAMLAVLRSHMDMMPAY